MTVDAVALHSVDVHLPKVKIGVLVQVVLDTPTNLVLWNLVALGELRVRGVIDDQKDACVIRRHPPMRERTGR